MYIVQSLEVTGPENQACSVPHARLVELDSPASSKSKSKVTASMARGVGRGPRPLRSPQHVWGLPGLMPVELGRVTSANSIYEETAAFVVWILDDAPDVLVTVENPLHSLMWMLPPFQSLLQRLHLVSFDACRHGSTRAKATGFLTNHDAFSSLSGPCPGCVQHDAWGQTPDGAWSTKLETAYPRLLCQRLLACAAPVAAARGLQPDRDAVNPHALARAAAAVQPRGRKFPPVISEFAYTVAVRSTSEPPLNEKSALSSAWMMFRPMQNFCATCLIGGWILSLQKVAVLLHVPQRRSPKQVASHVPQRSSPKQGAVHLRQRTLSEYTARPCSFLPKPS